MVVKETFRLHPPVPILPSLEAMREFKVVSLIYFLKQEFWLIFGLLAETSMVRKTPMSFIRKIRGKLHRL
ncbi:hypothetical protein Golob_017913 [Gossypium lobatum]|uniref:Uncharacterized protein n=1 Tax=Gossypium lobatum TaxID=34289 RepID=A0A7J8M8N0_9ROSI|nr:hypothetical protein [Gossypium lobatum]